jgi:hypothetical protein
MAASQEMLSSMELVPLKNATVLFTKIAEILGLGRGWTFTQRYDHTAVSQPVFHTALTACLHTQFSTVQEFNVSEKSVGVDPTNC